jgi:hypothetical protein
MKIVENIQTQKQLLIAEDEIEEFVRDWEQSKNKNLSSSRIEGPTPSKIPKGKTESN